MITYLKLVPLGFYRLPAPESLPDLAQYILTKETQILELDRTWSGDRASPTSARYKNYNFFGDSKIFSPTDELLETYRTFLRARINQFYEELGWEKKTRWLQSWVNIHHKGQFLHNHIHEDCRLSGHLTVACEGTRTTYFHEGVFEVVNEPGILTLIGADRIPHRTSVVTTDKPRISIAFDVLESEEKKHPHWVKLT